MFVIATVSLVAWFLSLKTLMASDFILRRIQKMNQFWQTAYPGKISNTEQAYGFQVFSLSIQTNRIGSSMSLIGTLANILPLLGLLGTVLGMLVSFEVIQSYGRSQPQLLAGGISQALITTQAGLWTAVPVFFFHHIIRRKMRLIRNETEILLHELQQSRNNKLNVTNQSKNDILEDYDV